MTLPVKPINEIEEKSEVGLNDKILILDADSEEARLASKDELKGDKGDQGDPGTPGAAATITVGTTSTGAAGTPASVTNSGTSSAAIFNFTIPKGDKGDQGNPGQDGDDGNGITSVTSSKVGKTTTVVMNFDEGDPYSFQVKDGEDGVGGDVFGPSSSTNGHLVVFDGTTGKLLKDGGALPSVINNLTSTSTTDALSAAQGKALKDAIDNKQDKLVSGTNIKTVNSTSLLGSGNIAVQPTLVSGTNIKTVNSTSLLGSGDISVQPTLVSGTNIKTINSNSLLGSGNLTLNDVKVSATAPSSPTEGMVWYDTTNDVLKTYNGTSWDEAGGGGDVRVFAVPSVNDDISDMITRLSAGKGVILHEMVSGTDAFYKVDYHDDVNCEITASLIYSYNGGYARVYTIEYNYSTKRVITKTPSLIYFFAPATAGTQGQVLTKTASGYEWQQPSGGEVMVSSQSGNILTSGMSIWAGTQSDYDGLDMYDSNTVYLTI